MALKQHLQLKQQQKLSPLQIQVIKLTELPCLELEERIKQEIEDNPALDEGHENDDVNNEQDFDEDEPISQEDIVLGDYRDEDEMPDYQLPSNSGKCERKTDGFQYSSADSLHEHLLKQLTESKLDEAEQKIGEYIIGNIDHNGYLDRSMSAISDDLVFQQNIDVSEAELNNILTVIQDFDPAGIAARNLKECLLIQLKRKKQTQSVRHALSFIEDYFEEFSKKQFEKILKQTKLTEKEFKDALEEITVLNPKPGNAWDESGIASNTIIPDFLVEYCNGELTLSLNNHNIPELKINKKYVELLKGYNDNKEGMNNDTKNAALFAKQKLDSARWFIEAIKQRQDTLQRTMQAIVDMQYDFFMTGDESQLHPMILKDVAEKTGYDISTISRVSNSKYVQTNFGIYPVKFFFSESTVNDSGEEISTKEVKAILRKCIDTEDKRNPLTDEKLGEILKQNGYIIARRTVAKYREQMNIPVARFRKEIV